MSPQKIMKKPNIIHYACALALFPICLVLMLVAALRGERLPLSKGGPRE